MLLPLNTTFQFSLSSFLKAAHFFNEQTASLNCLNWLTSPTLTGSSVCVWWQFTESTSGLSGCHGSANSPKLAHAIPRNRFRQSTSINTSTSIGRQTVPQTVQLECLLEIFFFCLTFSLHLPSSISRFGSLPLSVCLGFCFWKHFFLCLFTHFTGKWNGFSDTVNCCCCFCCCLGLLLYLSLPLYTLR